MYSWYNLVKPRCSTSQFGMVRLGIPTRFYIGFFLGLPHYQLEFFCVFALYTVVIIKCVLSLPQVQGQLMLLTGCLLEHAASAGLKNPTRMVGLPVTVTKKGCPVDSWFMIHILQLHLHLYTITYNYNYIYIACTYLEFFSSWSSSIEFVYRLKLPPCAACPRRSSGGDERWVTQWTWENHRWIFLQAMFDTVGYLPLHPITVHPINIPLIFN